MTIDLEHLRRWIGKPVEDRDDARVRQARLMANTIDLKGAPFRDGHPLPALWHWIYFAEALPPAQLGIDGHAARGGFLPPVPLPNRLWAGGRVRFEAPLPLGASMDKRSQVTRVEHKRGAGGDIVFVTVLHEVFVEGRRCVCEEHDIAYKNPPQGPAATAPAAAPAPGALQQAWQPDIVQLFRYSALTFNSTRAHYDLDYCRNVEGYDSVLVHGPLTATMLAGLATQAAGRPLARFDYKARNPFLLGRAATLNASVDGGAVRVWATLDDGRIAMEAEAS